MTRDDLIEQVKRGGMTPNHAEEVAARLGLPPLLNRRNAADFDPMGEPFWTVPMALTWIMTRDPELVRDVWDRWRAENEFWFFRRWQVPGGPVYEGYFVEPRGHVNILELTVHEAAWQQESKLLVGQDVARNALLRKLQNASLEAYGIPSAGGFRAAIPCYEWCDLDFFDDRGRVIAAAPLGAGYKDVVLACEALQKEWPGIDSRKKMSVRDEKTAIQELARQLEANPNMSRKDAKDFCLSQFAVSQRRFQSHVWPEARTRAGLNQFAPAGRKRKSSP